ncbi:MAG: class I adenylate-forming enzyme family protein [Acidimicrobiales bacterium]|nr:class I adenylate-forming enzyme family protein [Acidimicrobiales bacterium]
MRLLHHGLQEAAERFGERDAIRHADRSWSFAELDGLASAFARHLEDRGVAVGDRVAVMTSNRVEFVTAVQGASRLGAVAALFSPAWKATEVGHAVELTEPTHAVVDGDATALVAAVLSEGRVTDLDDRSTVDAAFAHDRSAPGVAVDDAADAVMVFSSGTTGMPKAVRHTHASLGHGTDHWVASLGLGPDDRFQVATPPSHILGLLNLLAAARAGVTVRLHARFDLDEVLRRIESDRITLEMAVAPIALALADHPDLESFDLSSLRYIMWGATPVTPRVAEIVTERTGVRWLPAYGASELPVLACNPVDRPDEWRLDSAGLPPDGVELRVVDLDTGEVLPAGETGEIQARSRSVMAGYLPDEATAAAFDDGWYRTGDVGWLEPEGWVHLTDRSKEMIKVKGFQVAPAEIEAVLHGHPDVVDCAVFGVDDPESGEVPVAAVKIDPGKRPDDGELESLVAGSLATYKHLRHLVVVDDIPRLASGKVLRRTLRDELAPRLAGAVEG